MPIGSIASLANPIVGSNVSITANTKVFQAEAKEYKDLWQMKCLKIPFFNGDSMYQFKSEIINPYIRGLYGNWRGWRNFVHYNQRNVASLSTPSNIRADGYIPNFTPYWTYDGGGTNFWISNSSNNWVRSDSMRLYDMRGNEIESSDANNIPSAAYYGFNGTQVVAVTSNSTYKEATYDSFEDYDFRNDCSPSIKFIDKNIQFYDSTKKTTNYLLSNNSHTGKYSLQMGANTQAITKALMGNEYCSPALPNAPAPVANFAGENTGKKQTTTVSNVTNAAAAIGNGSTIINNCNDCLPDFFPIQGKRYTLSAWVASDTSLLCNAKPTNMKVYIAFDSDPTLVEMKPQGPVIDGWQKLEGSFVTSSFAKNMYIRFNNTATTMAGYIDDVRVLPFNAKMKAYAYDWRSRRLMAELDENHYATFYEYDDEGILVRIKRETETGIQTVKEARNYLKPNN